MLNRVMGCLQGDPHPLKKRIFRLERGGIKSIYFLFIKKTKENHFFQYTQRDKKIGEKYFKQKGLFIINV